MLVLVFRSFPIAQSKKKRNAETSRLITYILLVDYMVVQVATGNESEPVVRVTVTAVPTVVTVD